MNATITAKPTPSLPISRIRNTRDLFALVPREIHHLLLVVDPSDESETALTIALEIAERWGPQITLVCGARLSGWRVSEESAADTPLIDLLCRSWQVRRAYPDVTISRSLPTSVAEVLQEAVERNVDLIIVPEPLAARFRHPQLMMGGGRLRASCPVVVVAEPEDDWLLGHR
jgi:Universal stress protein family